jgi:hypothetical protein
MSPMKGQIDRQQQTSLSRDCPPAPLTDPPDISSQSAKCKVHCENRTFDPKLPSTESFRLQAL